MKDFEIPFLIISLISMTAALVVLSYFMFKKEARTYALKIIIMINLMDVLICLLYIINILSEEFIENFDIEK
jgi:hypothetical protein